MSDTIVMLKGPDRVRKRPAVIFGADGTTGAVNAIKMLLDIFITEAILGFSKELDVKIHSDNSISIRSFDRGLVLDNWQQDFCQLYAGPREMDEDYYLYLGDKHNALYGGKNKYKTCEDHGFNLCCVQYASEYMQVEAVRDGIKKTIDFKSGFSVSELKEEKSSEENNTFIHFLPDSEVFGKDTAIPKDDINEFLNDFAIAIPDFKCKLIDERSDFKRVYHYPNGVQDYVLQIATKPTTLFTKEIKATGKDRYNRPEYDAKVKISFCFCENIGKIMCLHNYKKLGYGGSHLKGVKEKVLNSINYKIDKKISFEDIKDNIIMIIESVCDENATCYENSAKKAIVNKMISDMSCDLISSDFDYYLKQNHDTILKLINY